MEDNLYDFETEPEKRPSFLTWLCILTFIGSGWAILSCIWSYTTAHKTATIFSENSRSRDSTLQKDSTLSENGGDTARVRFRKGDGPFGLKMRETVTKILSEDNIRKTAIGGFIAALLTLSGALLMWQLNRKGFYLYILGVVFGIMVPIYLYGHDLLAIGIASFTNFFGLVFIALYALNLSSMKRGKPKSAEIN